MRHIYYRRGTYLDWLRQTTTSLVTGVAVHILKILQTFVTLDSFIGGVLVNVIDMSF